MLPGEIEEAEVRMSEERRPIFVNLTERKHVAVTKDSRRV